MQFTKKQIMKIINEELEKITEGEFEMAYHTRRKNPSGASRSSHSGEYTPPSEEESISAHAQALANALADLPGVTLRTDNVEIAKAIKEKNPKIANRVQVKER